MKRIREFPLIRSFVDNIWSAPTLRKSSVTFSGTVLNALFGAVFYILAARYLGPAGFGIMTVALTILTLTSDMGDLGTSTGLINFVSRFISSEKTKAYKYLKLGLEVKVLAGTLIVILGTLIAPYIAESVFAKPQLLTPIRIAFWGAFALLLFSFIVSTLQAMQRFWSWSIIQVATNFLRLILFIILIILGLNTINSTMLVYILVPFLGFIIGLKMIGKDFLFVKNERSVAGNFFKYNKWVAAFTIFAAVGARMDTFITARLLDSVQVGIYSAANQMIKIVPQIVIALGTVIGPKMAEAKTFSSYLNYFKKTQMLVLILAVMGILTIPFVVYLIPFVFGSLYISSGPVFIVLLFSMLLFLISVPIHMSVFYYFSYPKLFFYISFFHMILVSLTGWVLTLKFGVLGMSFAVLLGQIFDLLVPGIYVYFKILKGKQNVTLG